MKPHFRGEHTQVRPLVVIATLIALAAASNDTRADAPTLVTCQPNDGATGVSIDVGMLELQFDRDMRTDSYTCWKSPLGEFPPTVKDAGNPWRDARNFALKLERLKPDTEYFVQLNADGRSGFCAAGDGAALPITTVRFKTAGESQPRQDIYSPANEASKPASPSTKTDRSCNLTWRAEAGQVHQMSQIVRMQLDVRLESQGQTQTQTVDNLFKVRYTDEFLSASDGRPTRIRRKITLAESMMKDPNTGEVQRSELPIVGMEMELRIAPDGSMQLERAISGDENAAREIASDSQWFELEPGRSTRIGETWDLGGGQLSGVLSALDMTSGTIAMRLAGIETDPQIHADVAKLEGRIKGRMMLQVGLEADADGTFKEDFVPEFGLPFLRHVEVKLQLNQEIQDNYGQAVRVTGTGKMEAIEERALMNRTVPTSATPSPQKSTGQLPPAAPPAERGSTNAQPRPGQGVPTVAFRRTIEPSEQAFSILIPAGWMTQGGIVRVDPISTGQAANAIEAKVNFAVMSDAAGSVTLHFLPKMMYIDNRGQPAAGAFPQGSVMNGVPVAYRPSAEDYLTQMVFPQLRPQAANVQVVEARKLPHLAAGYQQRMAAIPIVGGHFQFDAAVVTLEYIESGRRFRERMLTVIRDFGSIGAGMWDNHETVAFRAPADQYEQYEPIVQVVVNSVKISPAWLAGELRNQAIRTNTFQDTQADIQRIGREIAEHRQHTNAEINNDVFLMLTGQEEYINPYTGETEVDSGEWKYRWVNEAGEIVFTDDESYNPNVVPDPPFNRTDFKRSQVRRRFPND